MTLHRHADLEQAIEESEDKAVLLIRRTRPYGTRSPR